MYRYILIRQRHLRRWRRRRFSNTYRHRCSTLRLTAWFWIFVLLGLGWVSLSMPKLELAKEDLQDLVTLCIIGAIDMCFLYKLLSPCAASPGPVSHCFQKGEIYRPMTVFVMGVGHKSVPIVVGWDWSVKDLLRELRRKRRIPSLVRLRPAVHFDPHRCAALSENDVLGPIGVRDLSTLVVRFSLVGGSHRSGNEERPGRGSSRPPDGRPLHRVQASTGSSNRSARRRADTERFAEQLKAAGCDEDGNAIGSDTDQNPDGSRRNIPRRAPAAGSQSSSRPPPRRSPLSSSSPAMASNSAHTAPVPITSTRSSLSTPSVHCGLRDPSSTTSTTHDSRLAHVETSDPVPTLSTSDCSTREDFEFLEDFIHTTVWSYGYRGPLIFHSPPSSTNTFCRIDPEGVSGPNSGPHPLSEHACNEEYLRHERWLFSIRDEVLALPITDDFVARRADVLETLRHEFVRLELHKESEWNRQQRTLIQCNLAGVPFVDTVRNFVQPYCSLSPMVLGHHLTALMMHLFYRLPRRASNLLLVSLRSLLRMTFAIAKRQSLSSQDAALVDNLPIDIRTIMNRFDLDPQTRTYICCPTCYTTYGTRPLPNVCSGMETATSQACGSSLWRTRTIRGKTFSFPLQTFLYQELKTWLGRLLSREGLEEIMDAAATRLREPTKSVMTDIWDAPVLRELLKDGKPFVLGPPEEGRYIFALYIDSFNPYQSKEAKQTVSVTGVYLVCLNLPPHLRYLPENMLLVGVIPGPHKPSLEQLNHFLRPLVDELLVFWETGVFFSRTAKHALGRLVRAALVPLVCDLPAARQTAGFGGHGAKFFCSMCTLTKASINDIRYKTWIPRTCHQHRVDAEAWRAAPSVSARNTAFKANSTRWSELLRLPYWDPIKYTVIDSMHNHYLGLLKFHCRRLWGMNISAVDAEDPGSHTPSQPPEEELARGTSFLYSGSEIELATCSKRVLKYLCSTVGIVTSKESHDQLVKRLVVWRTKQGISPTFLTPSEPTTSGAGTTTASQEVASGSGNAQSTRGAATREKIASAETTLAKAASANSLVKKYNIATLQVLCKRRGLLETGGREVLASRLLQARNSGTAPVQGRDDSALPQPRQEGNPELRPAFVEDSSMTVVDNASEDVPASTKASAVLGRNTLSTIHEQLSFTELPSWINPVPRNVGTTARGKLSADQWHVLCIVHLPVILIRQWSPKGGLFKRMLDNYMYLVAEVMIGSLLEMSEETIVTYETAAYEYLNGAQSLYDFQLTPNHHNSLHIPFFMRYFGPLHSIRTFFSERMNYLLQRQNTNLKFGELELTYMRHTCRASNLRALLGNNAVCQQVSEIVGAYEHLQNEDRRGTRLRESIGLRGSTDTPGVAPTQIILDNSSMAALVSCLNRGAGKERFIDARSLRRIPGTIQLLNRAIRVASVQVSGVTFKPEQHAAKDSNVLYATDATKNTWAAGRIEAIFSYSYRDGAQRVVEDTYLFVKQYQPLSQSDSELDIFRAYPHVGGWLVYDRFDDRVVILSSWIIAHFARTPMTVDGISSPCVHVLPLDKSVRILGGRPQAATGQPLDGIRIDVDMEEDGADVTDSLGRL